jgi:hypothetical protein
VILGAILALSFARTPAAASLDGFIVGAPLKWSLEDSRFGIDGFYPEPSQRNDKDGHVTLICALADSQKIKTCQVAEETPKGWQFSDAALAISQRLAIDPAEMALADNSVALSISFKGTRITADLRRLTPAPKAQSGPAGQ